MDFLFIFSLFFEFLALFLAFYFHDVRIFFLSLSLLVLRVAYLFSPVFQAHLFLSLFLPLIFLLFYLKNFSHLIFSLQNIQAFLFLILVGILALILPQNTHFNATNLNYELVSFYTPLNELGFVFFLLALLFLGLRGLKNLDFIPLLTLFGAYISFLIKEFWSFKYFEFASCIFCFILLFNAYKMLFFDSLTKFGNEKKLSLYLKNKEEYFIALLHFDELSKAKESYQSLILKQIAKILRRLKAQIFFIDKNFILIFKDEESALRHLGYLESLLKNTNLNLENENFKLEFKLVWQKNEGGLWQNLQSLKDKLLKA